MERLFANDGRYIVYRSTAVPAQAIYRLVRTTCPEEEEEEKNWGFYNMIVHTDGSFGPNALDHDSDRICEAHGIVGCITCAYTAQAHETPCNPWVEKEGLPFRAERSRQCSVGAVPKVKRARTYRGAETSRPP